MKRGRSSVIDYGKVSDQGGPIRPAAPSIDATFAADPRDDKIVRRNKFSNGLVADARRIFEKRLGRPISDGEARNLLGDLTDYYWLLIGWEARRTAERPPPDSGEPTEENLSPTP